VAGYYPIHVFAKVVASLGVKKDKISCTYSVTLGYNSTLAAIARKCIKEIYSNN